jgi:hypothetical protein
MKHIFEHGTSKTGFPQQSFVIEIQTLDFETLKALPVYLIDHCHLIFEEENTTSEDTMWPVKVSIDGQLAISEKIMWEMVCETLPNAKDLIIDYIEKLCHLAKDKPHGELLLHDEYHYCGSFAIISFFDWFLEQDESATVTALPVYNCFTRFIMCCDLDIETFQDEYIEKVLDKLSSINSTQFIELLAIRLSSGQLAGKDFRYLHHFLENPLSQPAHLKELIDYLTDSNNINIDEYYRTKSASYLRLCAAIYGSNDKQTDEILDYANQRLKGKLKPIIPFQLKEIQRIKTECDAFRAFQPVSEKIINSSFHSYDLKSKQWLP